MSANEGVLDRSGANLITFDGTGESFRFQHFPVLDGVRAVAILTVILYHLEFLVPGVGSFMFGGYLGVDIFFVLSGFLITSILLKEQNRCNSINLKNFFLRRFFRLAPAFWFFLITLYLFGNYILPVQQAEIVYGGHNFLYAFFYLMNWHKAVTGGSVGNLSHTWSLAIEEQFYIVWSVILFWFFSSNKNRDVFAAGTILLIVSLIILRGIRAALGTDVLTLYYSTDSRIDALLFGCLASIVYCWKLLPAQFFSSRIFNFITVAALLAALSIFFSFSYTDISLYYGGISLFGFSISIVILWLVTHEKTPAHFILESSPFRWIGHISYALYLWHYAFFEFAKKTFDSVPIQIISALGLALLFASCSFYLVEKPFLKLKDRFNDISSEKAPSAIV